MKFSVTTLAAAALLVVSPLAAAQQQSPVDYMNTQLALGLVEDLDNPLTLVVTGGKRFRSIAPNFSAEAEFTNSISAAEGTISGVGISASYWSLGGYGVMSFPVDERLSARARAGLRYIKSYANNTRADDFGPSFGMGVSYRYAANLSFMGEFTYMGKVDSKSVNHLSAGIQLHF